jgi:hypothetical protein
MVRFAAGQTLLPAEAVMAPSGPNSLLLFVLTILAALAVGVLLSLPAEKGMLRWPDPRSDVSRGWLQRT